MTRYAQRTLIQQGTVANWGKAAPVGIGVVGGYGVATGGTSSSITVSTVAYTLLTFTTTGSLVVATAGLFDVLMVGGGGGQGSDAYGRAGGGGGGGGVNGHQTVNTVYITAGTHTVTIGAGGGGNAVGAETKIGTFLSVPGGGFGGGRPPRREGGFSGGGDSGNRW